MGVCRGGREEQAARHEMARIGIIADIHANEEALSAALGNMGRVDKLLCLGDVVGYGASPDASITMVREVGAETILGNHEQGLLGTLDLFWFNDFAQAAIEWQRSRISEDNLKWLASLPETLDYGNVKLVHGAPPRSQTRYMVTVRDVERSMRSVPCRICLVGHSHLPGLFISRASADPPVFAKWTQMQARPNTTIRFARTDRLLINPGSVGQPRDGSPLASFAILDTFRGELTLRRIPYAVHDAQKKIQQAGLPSYLAERLAEGR